MIPNWYSGHARLLLEPFGKDVEYVDWLTWAQVEELYLKPQRKMIEAMKKASGGDSDDVNSIQDLPGTFEEFVQLCRSRGYSGPEEDLRAAYEQGRAAT